MIGKILSCVALGLVFLVNVYATGPQDGDPVGIGETKIIHSKVFDEEKAIYISLPFGYRSSRSFPVLYLLDGLGNFIRANAVMELLGQDKLPEMIIVGVSTNNRQKEYSLADLAGSPSAAREEDAGKTLRFLTQEVMPYVNSNYRTTDYKLIFGGSLSASYVLYIMMTDPDAFDVYIASSPNIGHSGDFLLNRAQEFFSRTPVFKKRLYISYSRKEHWRTTLYVPRLIDIISTAQPQDFDVIIKPYDEIRHNPFYIPLWALTALYPDWSPAPAPEITPNVGRIVSGKPLRVSIRGEEDATYYTLDGTEPTRKALKYGGPFVINEPTTIKSRIIRGEIESGPVSTSEITAAAPLAGEKKLPIYKSGLLFRYFERLMSGDWPEAIPVPPDRTGVIPTIEQAERKKDVSHFYEFIGYIEIKKAGNYIFYLQVAHPCLMTIGPGTTVQYQKFLLPEQLSIGLYLKAGLHPVRILSADLTQDDGPFTLSFEGPGIQKQTIPARILYHKN